LENEMSTTNRLVGFALTALCSCGVIVPLNTPDAGDGTKDAGADEPSNLSEDSAIPVEPPPTCMGEPLITINPVVNRYWPGGQDTPYPLRPANEEPSWLDGQDCQDDIVLQFNLSIACLPTTDTIEVWAGTTDCSQPSARKLGGGPYCWQVARPGTFGNSSEEYGNISARNIVRFFGASTSGAELDAVSGDPGPSVCQPLGPVTSPCDLPLTVYFMYMPSGVESGRTPDSYVTYDLGVFGAAAGDGGACRAH
jgi:hypothetical protein